MHSGEAQVISERLGMRFAGDVRSLLKRHQVPCGGAADLRRLGEFLFASAAFRSDLFALCSSISHMADEDLTGDELLGLVAESYGQGLTVPEEVRAEFLAAYQGWSARELAVDLPAERSVGEVKAADPAPSTGMNEVDETLQRLSVSSLELKMFLADVKQRVSEIDPELERLERMMSQVKHATHGTEIAEPASGDRVAAAGVAEVAERATVRRLRLAVAALALALSVTVACGAWLARGYFHQNESAARIVDGTRAGESAGLAGGIAMTPRKRAVATGAGFPAKPQAGTPAAHAGTPMVRAAAAVRMPVTRVLAARRVAEPVAVHAPAPIVRVDPDVKTGVRAGLADPVFVPSSTMIGYALAAPKPVYPAVSVPDDKVGRVEVQATISREGEVVATRVVSGPVVFREAADQAMRNWRFRPYLVDGRPVEVSTTVAFVFRSMPAT